MGSICIDSVSKAGNVTSHLLASSFLPKRGGVLNSANFKIVRNVKHVPAKKAKGGVTCQLPTLLQIENSNNRTAENRSTDSGKAKNSVVLSGLKVLSDGSVLFSFTEGTEDAKKTNVDAGILSFLRESLESSARNLKRSLLAEIVGVSEEAIRSPDSERSELLEASAGSTETETEPRPETESKEPLESPKEAESAAETETESETDSKEPMESPKKTLSVTGTETETESKEPLESPKETVSVTGTETEPETESKEPLESPKETESVTEPEPETESKEPLESPKETETETVTSSIEPTNLINSLQSPLEAVVVASIESSLEDGDPKKNEKEGEEEKGEGEGLEEEDEISAALISSQEEIGATENGTEPMEPLQFETATETETETQTGTETATETEIENSAPTESFLAEGTAEVSEKVLEASSEVAPSMSEKEDEAVVQEKVLEPSGKLPQPTVIMGAVAESDYSKPADWAFTQKFLKFLALPIGIFCLIGTIQLIGVAGIFTSIAQDPTAGPMTFAQVAVTMMTGLPAVSLLVVAFFVFRFRGAALGLLEMAKSKAILHEEAKTQLAAIAWYCFRQVALSLLLLALLPMVVYSALRVIVLGPRV